MTFSHALIFVTGLLYLETRVSYRRLKKEFGLDDQTLDDVCHELIAKRIAVDESGLGLSFVGAAPTPTTPGAPATPLATARPVASVTVPAVVANNTVPIPPEAPDADPVPDRRGPEPEHRQLTVLFCDLVGSTDLSRRLDPEDLREVVRIYQETAAGVIQRYAGHIAQYLGDGLLVYFGYPLAHEDDALRAVLAALDIVDALASMNTRLESGYGVRLAVRLGIHTGPVVIGQMGGGGRHEHLALGDTPNIAARLEALAAPDTIVISPRTARLLPDSCVLVSLGPQTLKGLDLPMEVWTVRGLRDSAGDPDRAEAAAEDSARVLLVGRDEEIGLLRRRWAQSKEGLGQVVLITGEAGIGKSSLVRALTAHVRSEGTPRITYRCSAYHASSALYPVITHLQQFFQIEPDDAPDVKLAKLERGLAPYALPVADVVPSLAALLSIPLPVDGPADGRYPALQLSPEQRRQQTLDALQAWLLAEADRQPILVLWEDLHWADPTTLELLGGLIGQVAHAAILSVLTCRPEFVPPWPARSHLTPVTLNRLERPQVEALVTRAAGGKRLPPEVVAHIVNRADGVPLYVEELTLALLESTILQEGADHYQLTGPLTGVAIPETLRDLLMARLDRLSTLREVAQLAAVLGRDFSYEMLHAITALDEPRLRDALGHLVEADLLHQRGRPPRSRYVFKHALIRDTAYQSLLKRTRQQCHQQVAKLLEDRFPEVASGQPELVAHHYTEANCPTQAIAYWHKAGMAATGKWANVEAIDHLRRGIALIEALPDARERAERELDLQMALGPALFATKSYSDPDIGRTYARAWEICQQLGDYFRGFTALRGLMLHHQALLEMEKAQHFAEEAVRVAEHLDDAARLVGGHMSLGSTLHHQGKLEPALRHFRRGIELFDPNMQFPDWPGAHPKVQCQIFLALISWMLGYPDRSLEEATAAVKSAEALGHPLTLVQTLCFVAIVPVFRQEPSVTTGYAGRAMKICAERPIANFHAFALCLNGWALSASGEEERGAVQIAQAVDSYGAGVNLPLMLALQADAQLANGKPKSTLESVAAGLRTVEKMGGGPLEAEFHRLRGEALLAGAGTVSEAEAAMEHGIAVARRQNAKSWELRGATSLARLRRQQGRHEEGVALLAPVYGWFAEGLDTGDLQAARTLLAELAGDAVVVAPTDQDAPGPPRASLPAEGAARVIAGQA